MAEAEKDAVAKAAEQAKLAAAEEALAQRQAELDDINKLKAETGDLVDQQASPKPLDLRIVRARGPRQGLAHAVELQGIPEP